MTSASMLRKPLLGGIFAAGEFELATQPLIVNGLHAVRFLVIEPKAGRVLAIADSKIEVLAGARRVLRSTCAANDEPEWIQPALWPSAELAVVLTEPASRPVSRRRREIFVRSGGKCFYCGTPQRIDGAWQAEHQRPKALGGTDEPLNLVAACQRCNSLKSTQTAIEFITAQPSGRRTG